jgi:hypothetical protein
MLLAGIRNMLDQQELSDLLESISQIVDEDAQCPRTGTLTQLQLCACIQPEVDAFLDAARKRFNQLSEELQQQVQSRHKKGCCVSSTGTQQKLCSSIDCMRCRYGVHVEGVI